MTDECFGPSCLETATQVFECLPMSKCERSRKRGFISLRPNVFVKAGKQTAKQPVLELWRIEVWSKSIKI